MTRWIALTGVVALGLAAVFFSERRKVDVPPGPAALLYLIADTEQELTRMPVRFTRMSDEEEIRIGNQIAHEYGFLAEKHDRDTTEVERYVSQVGARVAAHADCHTNFITSRSATSSMPLLCRRDTCTWARACSVSWTAKTNSRR